MSQGVVIYPALWLIMIDEFVCILGRSVVKVAYAVEFVVLVSGIFPSIMTESVEGAWRLQDAGSVSMRAPIKMELFFTETRVPEFHPRGSPRLNEQKLILSAISSFI